MTRHPSMRAGHPYREAGTGWRVRFARVIAVFAAMLIALATAQPTGAVPLPGPVDSAPFPGPDDVGTSETQTDTTAGPDIDTGAGPCDIYPGVDHPVYNTVCPLWMSTAAPELADPVQTSMAETGGRGADEFITRAAPNGEYLVKAEYMRYDSVEPQMMLRASRTDTGAELWATHYKIGPVPSFPTFTSSYPLAMAVSPDSRYIYVTGWINQPRWTITPQQTNAMLGFVLKVDAATGDTVWVKVISDVANLPSTTVPRFIAVSADGGHIYVAGDAQYWQDCADVDCNATALSDKWASNVPFAVALDASSGEVTWRVDDTEQGSVGMGAFGWVSALSPDGTRLYQVQALIDDPEHDKTYWLHWVDNVRVVGYDTATGEQVWESRYDYPEPAPGAPNAQYKPAGVVVSPDGNRVYVTTSRIIWSTSGHVRNVNFLAIAWDTSDSTGDMAWASESDWSSKAGCPDGRAKATDAVLSPTGDQLYVIGNLIVDGPDGDGWCTNSEHGLTVGVLSLDTATGQQDWSTLYTSPGHHVTIPELALGKVSSYWVHHVLGVNAHIKAGAGPGDHGSQIYISALDYYPNKDQDSEKWVGDGNGEHWVLGLGFDGITGQQIWQARYTDPNTIHAGPETLDSVLSPDGDTLHLTAADHARVEADVPPRVDRVTKWYGQFYTAAYPTAGSLPVAVLAVAPPDGRAPLRVGLDASGSRDPNEGGAITRYRFDFGDGGPPVTGTSPTVTHTYRAAGTYTATVTVTGTRGGVTTTSTQITVQTP